MRAMWRWEWRLSLAFMSSLAQIDSSLFFRRRICGAEPQLKRGRGCCPSGNVGGLCGSPCSSDG
eukprot:8825018-Prorocentrum_lima.AAC.1